MRATYATPGGRLGRMMERLEIHKAAGWIAGPMTALLVLVACVSGCHAWGPEDFLLCLMIVILLTALSLLVGVVDPHLAAKIAAIAVVLTLVSYYHKPWLGEKPVKNFDDLLARLGISGATSSTPLASSTLDSPTSKMDEPTRQEALREESTPQVETAFYSEPPPPSQKRDQAKPRSNGIRRKTGKHAS